MARLNDTLSINQAMEMPAEDLMDYLNDLCVVEIPATVDTVDDMRKASSILSRCASLYSYLINMQMSAKVAKRKYKRSPMTKDLAENALVREEIFGNYAEIIKTAYNAVSRMVTIKQQINTELRMTGDHIT